MGGITLTIPDLDMSGNFTGKAKFYVSNDPSGNDEVCKEVVIKEVPDNSQPLLFPSATKLVARIRPKLEQCIILWQRSQ